MIAAVAILAVSTACLLALVAGLVHRCREMQAELRQAAFDVSWVEAENKSLKRTTAQTLAKWGDAERAAVPGELAFRMRDTALAHLFDARSRLTAEALEAHWAVVCDGEVNEAEESLGEAKS